MTLSPDSSQESPDQTETHPYSSICNGPIEGDPTSEEAIALTVAIARFREEQAQGDAEEVEEKWEPDRWSLHGRFSNLGTPVDRLPRSLPRKPWSAHDRVDLY